MHGRRGAPRVSLPDVCARLGIELNHHDALSDAEACARIAIAAGMGGGLSATP